MVIGGFLISKKPLRNKAKIIYSMALLKELRGALENTSLTYEEVRAFSSGLTLLTEEEQTEFYDVIRENPELIYPLYINFKAKLHAVRGGEQEWQNAIEQELIELEEYMSKKRVGNEIV